MTSYRMPALTTSGTRKTPSAWRCLRPGRAGPNTGPPARRWGAGFRKGPFIRRPGIDLYLRPGIRHWREDADKKGLYTPRPPTAGDILTHEETRKHAREDRKRLIGRLGTFTSLVFSMYEDRSKAIEKLIDAAPKELLYDFTDELSIKNRFYRISDPAAIGALASAMQEKKLYIADGHHRLSVAKELGLPYCRHVPDGHVLGRHRHTALSPGSKAGRRHEPRPRPRCALSLVRRLPRGICAGAATQRLIEEISSASVLSFLLYFKGEKPGLFKLTQKKAIDFDPDSHPAVRNLKVSVVHRGVLKHLLGTGDDAISYFNDADEAAGLVDASESDFAVFVPATSAEEVKTIADNGLFMPPKSTYFYPKILTGLVLYKYA